MKMPPIHRYVEKQADKVWNMAAAGEFGEEYAKELKILRFVCNKALHIIMLERRGVNTLFACKYILQTSHTAQRQLKQLGEL